jgi:hypothetical protein
MKSAGENQYLLVVLMDYLMGGNHQGIHDHLKRSKLRTLNAVQGMGTYQESSNS